MWIEAEDEGCGQRAVRIAEDGGRRRRSGSWEVIGDDGGDWDRRSRRTADVDRRKAENSGGAGTAQ
jgi:hypothetical protein